MVSTILDKNILEKTDNVFKFLTFISQIAVPIRNLFLNFLSSIVPHILLNK